MNILEPENKTPTAFKKLGNELAIDENEDV